MQGLTKKRSLPTPCALINGVPLALHERFLSAASAILDAYWSCPEMHSSNRHTWLTFQKPVQQSFCFSNLKNRCLCISANDHFENHGFLEENYFRKIRFLKVRILKDPELKPHNSPLGSWGGKAKELSKPQR
jgi:hypothetical protein